MTATREHVTGKGLRDGLDTGYREETRRQAGSDEVTQPEDAISEDLLADNYIRLARGVHGGFKLETDFTELDGVTGSVIERQATIDADAVVDGVSFVSSDENSEALVVVPDPPVGGGTNRVIFRGCTFVKVATDTDTFVSCATGTRVLFLGCIFRGAPSGGGVPITNAGAAANVRVVECINATNPFGAGVTVVGGF